MSRDFCFFNNVDTDCVSTDMMNRRAIRSGFTLIELLVVIAIIAILASILFPVFVRVRENARRSSCQSNMKQLGLGMMQYTQDYDEKLPCGVYQGVNGTNGQGWGGQVYSYVKSVQVFKCPSDSSKVNPAVSGQTTVSYAYNSAILTKAGGNEVAGRISLFNAPAKTVLLCEVERASAWLTIGQETDGVSPSTEGLGGYIYSRSYDNSSCGWFATGIMAGRAASEPAVMIVVADPNDNNPSHYCNGAGQTSTESGRHLEGSNFLLADGHVKWFKGSAVSTGYIASSTTAAQSSTWYAEGTENGTHAVTYSPR